jgi:uncharacterized repeat protein (TIGR02543 family)
MPTPQSITGNVFEKVTLSGLTLNVPAAALTAYRAADVWKDFGTIQAVVVDTLTFDAQGGTVEPATKPVTQSAEVGALPAPTRTGYTFTGWYTEPNGTGTRYDSSTVHSGASDFTLYAKWTGNPYTLSFNPQGGTLNGSSKTVTCGSAVGALPTPVRNGYTFGGWYTELNGAGMQYAADTVYSIAGDLTLHAKWTGNPYKLSFNPQGGTPSDSSKTVTFGEAVGELLTPERTGYTFRGWYTELNGAGMQYAADTVYSRAGNLTLHAKWTANTYTLSFDAQGGSTVNPASKTVTFDLAVEALPTLNRTGYTFGGWYTEPNGAGTQYTSTTTYITSDNTTLYAKWTANTYTLTFDAQDGTVSPASKTITFDLAVGELPTPERTGYTFGGWYTMQNGAGTQYTESTLYNTLYNAMGGLTLYAKWVQNTPTGVDAQLQSTIALYPNPFTSEVHLTGAAGCTLTVVTSAGAVVHTQKIVSAAETIVLGNLPSGVYIFQLEKDGKKAAKIMIND